jgi:triacylglycerol lipase
MSTNPLQLKYPIVLVHGLGAKSTYGPIDYFFGFPKLLRQANNQIFVADLTAWHTIEHRANQLKVQIEKTFPDPEQKVNLIGHSMGGLDARYLTSRLDFSHRIASVTTIGTPNHGSAIGDLATGLLPNHAFTLADRLLELLNSSSGAFKQITREYCNGDFLIQTPNVPTVAYFSATSAIPKPIRRHSLPIFWLPHRILHNFEGDNDGFVSVQSAMWGEHICTYSGDHYAQVGQILGRSRGLDYIKFYQVIISHLKQNCL